MPTLKNSSSPWLTPRRVLKCTLKILQYLVDKLIKLKCFAGAAVRLKKAFYVSLDEKKRKSEVFFGGTEGLSSTVFFQLPISFFSKLVCRWHFFWCWLEVPWGTSHGETTARKLIISVSGGLLRKQERRKVKWITASSLEKGIWCKRKYQTNPIVPSV